MSTDVLREEHERMQVAVLASRRVFTASPDSPFVREMMQAIDGYLEMRAQGVSHEDGCKGLAEVLRQIWPKHPTKFPAQCDLCEDTGWRERQCTHALRCARRYCRKSHPAHEHAYVQHCDCVAGDKFRARVAPGVDDEIASASRVRKPKPRGWSTIGR